MTKKKKSWVEKLGDSKGLPRVEKITEKMSKRWGTGARAPLAFSLGLRPTLLKSKDKKENTILLRTGVH